MELCIYILLFTIMVLLLISLSHITFIMDDIMTAYQLYYSCKFHINLSLNRIMSGFSDEVVVENARYAWKYAASRSITGTPEFIVNGVIVPEAGGYDKEKWEDFINKLLSSPY